MMKIKSLLLTLIVFVHISTANADPIYVTFFGVGSSVTHKNCTRDVMERAKIDLVQKLQMNCFEESGTLAINVCITETRCDQREQDWIGYAIGKAYCRIESKDATFLGHMNSYYYDRENFSDCRSRIHSTN